MTEGSVTQSGNVLTEGMCIACGCFGCRVPGCESP